VKYITYVLYVIGIMGVINTIIRFAENVHVYGRLIIRKSSWKRFKECIQRARQLNEVFEDVFIRFLFRLELLQFEKLTSALLISLLISSSAFYLLFRPRYHQRSSQVAAELARLNSDAVVLHRDSIVCKTQDGLRAPCSLVNPLDNSLRDSEGARK